MSFFDHIDGETALMQSNIDGTGEHKIEIEPKAIYGEFYDVRPIAWSPDNNNLLLSMQYTNSWIYSRLAIFQSDTEELFHIADETYFEHLSSYDSRWNADGSWLLYARRDVRCEDFCIDTVIVNIKSHEEIALPLLGLTSQWVRIP